MSAKKEKEQDTNPDNSIKIKKRRWDGLVIGIFMAIGFSVIIMKLTHHWPCEIIGMVGNIIKSHHVISLLKKICLR